MTNNPDGSISLWLQQLRKGDSDAIQALWKRYFSQLVKVAEAQLRKLPAMTSDGEDVAASVFESIWNGAKAGRFENVATLDDVWWCLMVMARNKCIDHHRREHAEKRGGNIRPLSLEGDPGEIFQQLVSAEPDPAYVVAFNEQYFRLLDLLADTQQRNVAVLRVEGHTVEEIAEQLGVSPATVNRKLRVVRRAWKIEVNYEPS